MTRSALALSALLVFMLSSERARAVPAAPFPIELRNADGTKLKARLRGDEYRAWAEDVRGYSLAFDDRAGAWRYARPSADGRLVPTPHRPGIDDPALAGIPRALVPAAPSTRLGAVARPALWAPPRPVPLQGVVRNLVLLVRFNCPAKGCAAANEQPTFRPQDFETLFNGTSNSVREYYSEITYGRMDLQSTIATGAWIQLPYDDAHYAYNPAAGVQAAPEDMVIDAVAALDRAGFDFTPFDADRDGVIDAIDVVHVGPGCETGSDPRRCIHSHYAELGWFGKELRTSQGISIPAYHTEPEFRESGGITALGTICHETGHFFGLIDLYDYTTGPNGDVLSAGLGYWSLMAYGPWLGPPGDPGAHPSHPDAWSRMRLGVVTPRTISTTTAAVNLAPAETVADVIRLDAGLPGREYFLLEHRQPVGFDLYLPFSTGSGRLAIYHVDDAVQDNSDRAHYRVDLEQADGRRDLNLLSTNQGDLGDLYPLATVDAFTGDAAARPNSCPYAGGDCALSVRRIAHASGTLTFDIEVGPYHKLDGAPCSLGDDCRSGHCVDSVCCDAVCTGGCVACALSRGASANGVCTPLSGSACDDGDPCTDSDACIAGSCAGALRPCPPPSTCHVSLGCGTNGLCSEAAAADGVACDDGDPCTVGDACASGVCVGSPKLCPAAPECQVSRGCSAANGCTLGAAADGTTCSIGTCRAGRCEKTSAPAEPPPSPPAPAPEATPVQPGCGCGAVAADGPAGAGMLALAVFGRRRRARPPRAVC